jgi:hypothetical protein
MITTIQEQSHKITVNDILKLSNKIIKNYQKKVTHISWHSLNRKNTYASFGERKHYDY